MSLLLNKYQIEDQSIQERGYSVTAKGFYREEPYFIKCLKGVENNKRTLHYLKSSLKKLKDLNQSGILPLLDYGYDQEQKGFVLVYEYCDDQTLSQLIHEVAPDIFLQGVLQMLEGLGHLSKEHNMHHGDLHPGNILVVGDSRAFKLIDFQLSALTQTLSQSADLEIFNAQFAAPEKLNPVQKGNATNSLSDQFSIGKLLFWYQSEKGKEYPEWNTVASKATASNAAERYPSYFHLIEEIGKLLTLLEPEGNYIKVEGRTKEELEFLSRHPSQWLVNSGGRDIIIDGLTEGYAWHGIWKLQERKLWMKEFKPITEAPESTVRKAKRFGESLPYRQLLFADSPNPGIDLGPTLQGLKAKRKQEEAEHKRFKSIGDRLALYKDALELELEEIRKRALKVNYSDYKHFPERNELQVLVNPHKTDIPKLVSYVERQNPQGESPAFFIQSVSKLNKNNQEGSFEATAYIPPPSQDKVWLHLKDLHSFDPEQVPVRGWILEDYRRLEQEKKRKLEAIRKVIYREVINPEMIHYLFEPQYLLGAEDKKPSVGWELQKDDQHKSFEYPFSQELAIQRGLHTSPVSLVQGPPGTGKTTVITEIILQILQREPEVTILVTSQTNLAVKHVLKNLVEQGREQQILHLTANPQNTDKKLRSSTLGHILKAWRESILHNLDNDNESGFLESQFTSPLHQQWVKNLMHSNDWKQTQRDLQKVIERLAPKHEQTLWLNHLGNT